MKLAIMQPYFFPYIGYFQMMQSVDRFVFFDTPQFERRSWMSRNRILNLKGGFTYINVPVEKAEQKTSFSEIMIDDTQKWKEKIFAQLEIYKNRAPHYKQTKEFVENCLQKDYKLLADLNMQTVIYVSNYLGLTTQFDVFSTLSLDIPMQCEADEWALNITKAMGFHEYVNAPGGKDFFDVNKYKENSINIQFIKPILTPYKQNVGRFESGLSIIDVLMFNSVEQVRNMLKEYTLE